MTDSRFSSPLQKVALFFLLLTIALFVASCPVRAQDDSTATGGDVTINEVNEVARELWCPLCSGVRLDVCELKACDQMREEIAIKLEEGQDTEQIKRYFITQYGPQVLGEPPREGFNLLAWILPVLIFIGGGVFVFSLVRHMLNNRREQEEAEAAESDNAVADERLSYTDRLDEELSRYDG